MNRFLKHFLLIAVTISCLWACQSETGKSDPAAIDMVQIHFTDKDEVKTYKQPISGGKAVMGSETLPLDAYTDYNVQIVPMAESGGALTERTEFWNQRLDSLFVLFENFDVGINYSRADLDSRSLPSGMLSKIRTFAPGEGTLHFTVKHGVIKSQPYNTGEKIIDITIPVSIQ